MMEKDFQMHLDCFSRVNNNMGGNCTNFDLTDNFANVNRNNSRTMLKEQNIHVINDNNEFQYQRLNVNNLEQYNRDFENNKNKNMTTDNKEKHSNNSKLDNQGGKLFSCYQDNFTNINNNNKHNNTINNNNNNNRIGIRHSREKLKENLKNNKSSHGYQNMELCTSSFSDQNDEKGKVLRDNCRFQKKIFYNGCNNTNFYLQPINSQHSSNNYYDKNSKRHNSSDDIARRVHGLMERFTSRANTLVFDSPIRFICRGSALEELDQSIWELYQSRVQKKEVYLQKLELWKKLYLRIGKLLEKCALYMVGSTMSGLATNNSDIDICLLVRMFSDDPRTDSVRYLDLIRTYLKNCDFVTAPKVIHAKVPILKFTDSEKKFQVDLNCNNSVGIRNTHLLHCYAHLDWRVQPLVIIVKLWAQSNHINDAKNMTISSYSLALMVIHYLQCGVNPPVLPCLHRLYPEKFNDNIDFAQIDVQEELLPFFTKNKQSLGELLLGFLHYFSYFNYDLYAISVRLGTCLAIDECRFARSPKNDPHQWKCLCIEEPFDFTNTARSVYDVETFKRIKQVFHSSYIKLAEIRRLESILVPFSSTANHK